MFSWIMDFLGVLFVFVCLKKEGRGLPGGSINQGRRLSKKDTYDHECLELFPFLRLCLHSVGCNLTATGLDL